MEIKAIMCDLDGTLLNSHGKVDMITVDAIKNVRKKGIYFGLSTGRDVNSVQKLLGEWGIDGLVDIIVGTGGAEIYDYKLNISESQFPLDGELIKSIIHHYEDMDVNFAIPENGIFYAPKDDVHIQNLSKMDKVPYKVVDFNEFLNAPKPKLIIVCSAEYMDMVLERSASFSNPHFKSSSLKTASQLYEYMDPRISKTAGLIKALNNRKISIKEIVTFGDADNDYDMIINAGIGVVMQNGSKLTKSVADYITDDNDHHGVGNFINKYILKI